MFDEIFKLKILSVKSGNDLFFIRAIEDNISIKLDSKYGSKLQEIN